MLEKPEPNPNSVEAGDEASARLQADSIESRCRAEIEADTGGRIIDKLLAFGTGPESIPSHKRFELLQSWRINKCIDEKRSNGKKR